MKHSAILRSIFRGFNSPAAFIFTLLLLMFPLMAFSSARAQTPQGNDNTSTNAVERAAQEANKAKSIVRGRVVYDDTNRPVRRARVMLLDLTKGSQPNTGTTNGAGEFQFKDVPAGRYVVMVDAPGIITPISFIELVENAGNEMPDLEELKKNFEEVVVNGTNTVNIKVRARRGGAINGKVTYADGDPAIGARINILRKKDGRNVRFITTMNPTTMFGAQTDDRGIYRIAGLPPGEYIVSATEMVEHSGGHGHNEFLNIFGSGDSFVVTYYQGVTKLSSATAIQVEAGQEQNEVNISLIERALHLLSGTVISRRTRNPVQGAQVAISSKDDNSSLSSLMAELRTVKTDEQGRFTFNEIPDGVYTLSVEPPYGGEASSGDAGAADDEDDDEEQPAQPSTPAPTVSHKLARKQQEVTLDGSDLDSVSIILTEGATVNGTVAVEGGGALPQVMSIQLQSVSGDYRETKQGSVEAGGKFAIEGVAAGSFYPSSLISANEQYYLKAITVNGVDLLREPLVVSDSVNVADMRVILGADAATLSGHLLSANNTPASSVRFVLIPVDQTRWRSRGSELAGFSEGDGSYSVSGAPGEYFIIFPRDSQIPQTAREAWFREHIANAQRVALLPSQRKEMDLTVPAQ